MALLETRPTIDLSLSALERAQQILGYSDEEAKPVSAAPSVRGVAHFRDYYAFRRAEGDQRREESAQCELELEERKASDGRRASRVRDFRKSLVASAPLLKADSGEHNKTKENALKAITRLKASAIGKVAKPSAAPSDAFRSANFANFFFDSSKFVQKALGITKASDGGADNAMHFRLPGDANHDAIRQIRWSAAIPELFLTTVLRRSASTARPSDGDSLYIWNVDFSARPEFELHSASQLASAAFSPFASEYVVAGLECGQLNVFDLRARKEAVLRSAPNAHKSPIVCLDFVGGQHANNIVSASEEGLLCLWSLLKLDHPLESVALSPGEQRRDNELTPPLEPFCLSVLPGADAAVCLGTADGNVYRCALMDPNGEKGLERLPTAHSAAISALDHNRYGGPAFGATLSGSLDWRVQLSAPKSGELLHAFTQHEDPITDVAWNPSHPALFVASDLGGNVLVFDLLRDAAEPVWQRRESSAVLNAQWDSTGALLAVSHESPQFKVHRIPHDIFDFKGSDALKV